MSNVVDFCSYRSSAAVTAADPVVAALAALPTTSGLATRVKAMIAAGASDVFVDVYVATWIESARADLDAKRNLHIELARHLGTWR
jgi:hypothetical protein